MQLLSYLTDACNIAGFAVIATTIGNFLLAHHRVASARTGSYLIAIALAFVSPWIASGLYVFVARLWLVPDRHIERLLVKREKE
jgi:uncharacterized membrane protein